MVRSETPFQYDTAYKLFLTRENLAESDPVIIPYMVVNIRFITLYGIISGSLFADYSYAVYNKAGFHYNKAGFYYNKAGYHF